jgi:hypothetical protein
MASSNPLRRFFSKSKWPVRSSSKGLVLAGFVSGANAKYPICTGYYPAEAVLRLMISVSMKVPISRRTHVLKLLGLLNQRVRVGGWELHPKGQILYCPSMPWTGGQMADEMAEIFVFESVRTVDRAKPVIESILNGKDPGDLLQGAIEFGDN